MSVKIEYIGSYHKAEMGPDTGIPEFALIGRSNVGKSSLINRLFDRRDLAHVSKQPGKTQSINFFLVEDHFHVVDLPGYGFALHSKGQRKAWEKMTRNYFLTRPMLGCVLVLMDGNIPLQKLDQGFINWLGENQIPFILVFTKGDRSKPAYLQNNIATILQELERDWESLPPYFITSSQTGSGKDELLEYLLNLAAEMKQA